MPSTLLWIVLAAALLWAAFGIIRHQFRLGLFAIQAAAAGAAAWLLLAGR